MILLPAANVLSSLQHFCLVENKGDKQQHEEHGSLHRRRVPFVRSQSDGIPRWEQRGARADMLDWFFTFISDSWISKESPQVSRMKEIIITWPAVYSLPHKKNAKTLNCGFVVTSITF